MHYASQFLSSKTLTSCRAQAVARLLALANGDFFGVREVFPFLLGTNTHPRTHAPTHACMLVHMQMHTGGE